MPNSFVPANITTNFSVPAAVRTANPFSIGSTQLEYVPEWLIGAFEGTPGSEYNKSGSPAKLAHLAFKTGLGIAAVGSIAWALRSLMHSMKIDAIDNMNPDVNAGSKINKADKRNVNPALSYSKKDEKKKQEDLDEDSVEKKASMNKTALDPYNTYGTVLTVGAPLLVALAMTAAADKHYDRLLGKKLDKDIAAADALSEEIAKRRILKARGVQPQILKAASVNKQAFGNSVLPRKYEAAIGLFLAAVIAAGFKGGFDYQRDNSKAVAKYKAYKKGLEGYSKEKLKEEAINSSPIDPRLADLFDSNLAQNKKSAPGIEADPMKEILI